LEEPAAIGIPGAVAKRHRQGDTDFGKLSFLGVVAREGRREELWRDADDIGQRPGPADLAPLQELNGLRWPGLLMVAAADIVSAPAARSAFPGTGFGWKVKKSRRINLVICNPVRNGIILRLPPILAGSCAKISVTRSPARSNRVEVWHGQLKPGASRSSRRPARGDRRETHQ
jgi:hypothetical protein